MGRLTGRFDDRIRALVQRRLPARTRERLAPAYRRLTAWPPVGAVRFGSLRRTEPISRSYGLDRGQPIDRFYIDRFLSAHLAADAAPGSVAGRVLEVGEDRYASRFAAEGAITRLDIVDATPENPDATVIADLAVGDELESDAYDFVICTQTLLYIYDVKAAIATLYRILKPGATLLVTVPGISHSCRAEMEAWGDYWRFTSASLRRLLEERFDPAAVTVEAFGNVMTAAAYLYGLAAEDLRDEVLEVRDPTYQLVVTAEATKGPG